MSTSHTEKSRADSLGDITSFLAFVFTGSALQQLEYGFVLPGTAAAVASLAPVLYVVGVVVTSAIGAVMLLRAVRGPRAERGMFRSRDGIGPAGSRY